MRNIFGCLAACAGFIAAPIGAHHSTSAYDYSKEVVIQGTVTQFQWTNPHMFIKIMAKGPDQKMAVWNIECGTPNINVRHGWKKSDIKVGDKLVMTIAPMRDRTPGGTLFTVKLADGRSLVGPAVDSRTLGFGGAPS